MERAAYGYWKRKKQILAKHRGYYVCVHPCSLQLVKKKVPI